MIEKANILALGPSVRQFKLNGAYTIGVNDIDKYHQVDCLVIVDHHMNFSLDRIDTIRATEANTVISQNDEWSYLPGFIQIELAPERSNLAYIESDQYVYSVVSAYVAVIHAYKLGAKEINMYGVDMGDDYKMGLPTKQQCVKDFYKLREYFDRVGVRLTVNSHMSLLCGVVPVKITG